MGYNRQVVQKVYRSKNNSRRQEIIHPLSCKINWKDHPGNHKGEDKVTSFLSRRGQILRNLDIPENSVLEMQERTDSGLISRIFCSNTINSIVK